MLISKLLLQQVGLQTLQLPLALGKSQLPAAAAAAPPLVPTQCVPVELELAQVELVVGAAQSQLQPLLQEQDPALVLHVLLEQEEGEQGELWHSQEVEVELVVQVLSCCEMAEASSNRTRGGIDMSCDCSLHS